MTDPGDLETSLAEMDRKLRELQRELELVSRGAEEPPAPEAPPARPGPATASSQAGAPEPGRGPPTAVPPPSPTAKILEQASARVAELSRRIDDLGRLRDDLEEATRALQEEHRRAQAAAAVPATAESGQAPEELVIDAGPFADIATLSAFELGLRRVDGVEDALVRSFEGNRAVVDVRLGRPLDLAAQLRDTLPFAFDVTAAGPGELTLTLRHPTG